MNETFPASGKPRLRRLSAEEIELWLNVTRGVARRPGSGSPQLPQPRNDAELQANEAGNILPKGARAETPPSPVERKAPPPLAPLERRLRQKLARGRAGPDAALDLHGMRRQEAFAALREFLARAQIEGARLVLVVTGKGASATSEDGTAGVLRKSVPNWLRGAEYRSIVAGFEEASRPHGGAGALYVRLRRRDRPARGKPLP
ncbi:MAG: Smr/MutS family protein [Methylocella sp.]|nr:MAG: DNA mismatch repair protein MutS [Hyphomicrobiales bacterium]